MLQGDGSIFYQQIFPLKKPRKIIVGSDTWLEKMLTILWINTGSDGTYNAGYKQASSFYSV